MCVCFLVFLFCFSCFCYYVLVLLFLVFVCLVVLFFIGFHISFVGLLVLLFDFLVGFLAYPADRSNRAGQTMASHRAL